MNQSALDQAITAAATAEATYVADTGNLATIQASIQTATAPLAPAEAQLSADAALFNASLVALSQAALAAVVPVAGP